MDSSSSGSKDNGYGFSAGMEGEKKQDSSIGEKIGIAIFFLLLVAALLFWWFQYGRGNASQEGAYGGQGMGNTADYGSMNYGGQDTTV